MAKITILERSEVLSSSPGRIGQYDVWVVYRSEDGRQEMVILPREGITEAKILEEIKRKEGERTKVVGKEFTI